MAPTRRTHTSSQQGMVLIALLWILAALALLAGQLASSVRKEVTLAGAAGQAERSYFFARGALETALYRLVFADADKDAERQGKRFPYEGGMNHFWLQDEEMMCHVAVLDEAGKMDLNAAPKECLEKLFRIAGVPETLHTQLAEAIITRRGNPLSPSFSEDREKARPFRAVEELLQVEGITRAMLYGAPERTPEGKIKEKRGLIDFLTVFSPRNQININYAAPEVIAALPGLDLSAADSIVQAREREAIKSSEVSQKLAGLLSGEALSMVTTTFSGTYSIVATARVKGTRTQRSIRMVARIDRARKAGHERLIWYDEYWPSQPGLKWLKTPDGWN
ncbi:MAG: general secretion pathway protein GspK [Acidobacteria bacterium]|nr:general secretion pathway protein GspK [Acidobacteriota bacterium]